MKFRNLKIPLWPYLLLVLCQTSALFSQKIQPIYTLFDNSIGMVNLGINNGPVHINSYRSVNATHRYFSDKYSRADLVYDGQIYYDVFLKYDIVKDQLIKKMEGESNTVGINLIGEKTAFFTLDGMKFVNLNYNQIGQPAFVKGYYEEYLMRPEFALYVKHSKDVIEVLKTEGVFYKFAPLTDFLISYNAQFYKAADEEDLFMIFPNQKTKIKDFYFMNKEMAKSNKIQFMKSLMVYLDNILIKEIKSK